MENGTSEPWARETNSYLDTVSLCTTQGVYIRRLPLLNIQMDNVAACKYVAYFGHIVSLAMQTLPRIIALSLAQFTTVQLRASLRGFRETEVYHLS